MERDGTRSMYRIDTEGLKAIRAWLDHLWDEALNNFKLLAEQTEKSKPKK
jgi:hypothetical protein